MIGWAGPMCEPIAHYQTLTTFEGSSHVSDAVRCVWSVVESPQLDPLNASSLKNSFRSQQDLASIFLRRLVLLLKSQEKQICLALAIAEAIPWSYTKKQGDDSTWGLVVCGWLH